MTIFFFGRIQDGWWNKEKKKKMCQTMEEEFPEAKSRDLMQEVRIGLRIQ